VFCLAQSLPSPVPLLGTLFLLLFLDATSHSGFCAILDFFLEERKEKFLFWKLSDTLAAIPNY
jgi:hypothetical protein